MNFEEWWVEYVDLMGDDPTDPHVLQMKTVAEDVWEAAQENKK